MAADSHLGASEGSTFGDFDALARRLVEMGQLARPALEAGVYELGNDILGDAQENYVPVDEAILKGSGYVTLPEGDDEVSSTIGFGGPASDYAEVQHERPDFQHTVGQWKYLETPFMNRIPTLPLVLAEAVERAFRRLLGL
jgi:hypothetical protein